AVAPKETCRSIADDKPTDYLAWDGPVALTPFRQRRSRSLTLSLRCEQGIEHLADLASKRVGGEGLLEEGRARVEHAMVYDGGIRVARHVDDRHRRAKGREPVRQLTAAHS